MSLYTASCLKLEAIQNNPLPTVKHMYPELLVPQMAAEKPNIGDPYPETFSKQSIPLLVLPTYSVLTSNPNTFLKYETGNARIVPHEHPHLSFQGTDLQALAHYQTDHKTHAQFCCSTQNQSEPAQYH